MVGYREGIDWDPEATLAGELSHAGYQTGWIGRSMHQWPPRKKFGFEYMEIGDHRGEEYNDYGQWLEQHQPPGGGGYYGTGVMHNDYTARPWHMGEYLHRTNWTVNRALDFLENRDSSRPFFLTVSFVAPHPPLIPPACYFDRYIRTGVPDPVIGDWAVPPENDGIGLGQNSSRVNLTGEILLSARAGYFGLINHIDDQIWRLINPVTGIDKQTGNNTIILYTSDHGEMLGDHYLWRKTVPYEPSARIPFLLRAPERFGIKRRMTLQTPVCLEDIMPTLLEMAECEIPESVEGKSLLAVMRGEDVSLERPYLHIEHAPMHHTLTDGKKKYIWFVSDGTEQFFDLTADPNECINLIHSKEHTESISWWRSEMIAVLKDRPEGFTDSNTLVPGRPYPPVMER
jgi:arylsulfatase A-like enzyme